MPEYRQNKLTGEWVIIATGRARRPESFCRKGEETGAAVTRPNVSYLDDCPFCYGNEGKTPPEIVAWRDGSPPDTPGWKVRVVPNLFPAVELNCRPWSGLPACSFAEIPGYGAHEVLIETPQHNRHPGELPLHQTELIIRSYYERMVSLAANPSLRFVQIFRNYRKEAGASIEHPHSQLVGLPFVPTLILQELRHAQRFYLENESCPYCMLLEEELSSGERVIMQDEMFAAFVPYAARMPFEIWIVPRKHQGSFTDITGKEQEGLAVFLMKVLQALRVTLDDPPYNYFLHSAPLRTPYLPYYHWHLEIFPRVTAPGGFEMGTGVYINVTVPEEAAHFLREEKECFDEHAEESHTLYPGIAQSPAGGKFS